MNVEVRQSSISEAGRGLFATQGFQPGDVILSLNRPYVAELEIERMQDTCAWCFVGDEFASTLNMVSGQPLEDEVSDLKACTGCRKVRYCSKPCQSKAWKREHKYECKIIASDSTPGLPHGVRAVIKLLGRLKADPDKIDDKLLDIAKFKPAVNDASFEEFKRRDPKSSEEFDLLAYGAWKYAGSPDLGSKDSKTLATCFFFNIMCNSLTLSSPLRDEPLGIAFDPLICTANHSCEPNAFLICNQPQLQLRALRPIKKDEELTISYVDPTNPFSIRQNSLRETYFFNCRCKKCLKGAKFPEDAFLKSPESLPQSSVLLADSLILRHENILSRYFVPVPDELTQRRLAALQAEAFAISGVSGEFTRANKSASEEEVRDALKMCLDSGLWSWTRQPVPHLLRQLLLLHLGVPGNEYRAWRLGAKMYVDVLPKLYTQRFHPERVMHAFLMVRITNGLCQPGNAEIVEEIYRGGLDLRVVMFGFAREFFEEVGKTYGVESPMGMVTDTTYKALLAQVPAGEEEMMKRVEETWLKFEAVAKSVDVLGM